MPKKYLTPLLAVILLAVIAVLAQQNAKKQINRSNPNPAAAVQSTAPLKVTKTEVPAGQLPEGFLAGIPMEKGAAITQNYNALAETGLFQATRVFVTAKSLDANFTLYLGYLKTNSWKITNTVNLAQTKVLSASKGPENLQITISQNSITKVKTVDISYSVQK